MYKKEVESLIQEISNDLQSCAVSYYNIGIERFHESRSKTWIDFQPAIGNLAISVELLLKSIVAKKAICHLYSNIPEEAKLLLSYPECLPKDHNPRVYIGDLKGFVYKTIEIDKCISLFKLFFVDVKHEYKQFFASLSVIRNISVHASIPGFQRYELERLAYFSTKLFLFVAEAKIHKYFFFKTDKNTDNFLKYYEDEKVKYAIEQAKEKVKSGKIDEVFIYDDDWDSMITTCPVCENEALLFGETEEQKDYDGINLVFHCDSFECRTCGLELDDFDELDLAGIETTQDRDSDLERWIDENIDPYYDDRM